MNTTSTSLNTEKLGTLPFVLAGISFIPLIGVPFGIATLIWGLRTKKHGGRRLATIGVCGIATTIIVYGALFYFGFQQRGGVYDDLRAKLAQSSINSLVPAIEFYKVQNGEYPMSLEQLEKTLPKDGFVSAYDPSIVEFSGKPKYYFYERVGTDNYYLRGLGPDGKPFTPDDIVPQIATTAGGKLGLLFERR